MNMDLSTTAAYAAIGSFVVEIAALIVALFIERRRGRLAEPPAKRPFNIRVVAAVLVGVLFLLIPGWAVCCLAIILAVSSPETPSTLIVRSVIWATAMAIPWGIVWSLFFLPPLVRVVQQRGGGT